MQKVVNLVYDPKKETKKKFEVRLAEAVAATGEPEENVQVIVREIKRPTLRLGGHDRTALAGLDRESDFAMISSRRFRMYLTSAAS